MGNKWGQCNDSDPISDWPRFLQLSVGVALGVTESWRDLVKRADPALYEAKDSGRNRVEAFT
jgi:PleD family two-component response regulator